jgi:hypothetical protein
VVTAMNDPAQAQAFLEPLRARYTVDLVSAVVPDQDENDESARRSRHERCSTAAGAVRVLTAGAGDRGRVDTARAISTRSGQAFVTVDRWRPVDRGRRRCWRCTPATFDDFVNRFARCAGAEPRLCAVKSLTGEQNPTGDRRRRSSTARTRCSSSPASLRASIGAATDNPTLSGIEAPPGYDLQVKLTIEVACSFLQANVVSVDTTGDLRSEGTVLLRSRRGQ